MCFEQRDKYIKWIEYCHIGCAVCSLLIVFLYLGAAGNFLSHEMFGEINNFRQAHKGLMLGSAALVLVGMLLSVLSIVTAFTRKTPWYLNCCVQVSLFFFVFVPFAAQASTLGLISSLSAGDFYNECNELV